MRERVIVGKRAGRCTERSYPDKNELSRTPIVSNYSLGHRARLALCVGLCDTKTYRGTSEKKPRALMLLRPRKEIASIPRPARLITRALSRLLRRATAVPLACSTARLLRRVRRVCRIRRFDRSESQDQIGFLHSRQPVRDHQHSPFAAHCLNRLVHQGFGF